MPSFPTSVFAPANRSAGQTIQPAIVNDVQDELVAIEGGYLNGTARLNSSNSTVAALGVTGHSTIGGRLVVSSGLSVGGNSTIASSVTFGTIPYVLPSSGGSTGQVLTCISTSGSTMGLEWRAAAVSAAEVVVVTSTGQQVAAVSTVGLTWTVQNVITNSSMHSTALNSDRLIPQSTGVFRVELLWRWRTARSTQTRLIIEDSTATIIAQHWEVVGSGAFHGQYVAVMKRFDVTGGWVRAVVFEGGTTNSLDLDAGGHYFAMTKM